MSAASSTALYSEYNHGQDYTESITTRGGCQGCQGCVKGAPLTPFSASPALYRPIYGGVKAGKGEYVPIARACAQARTSVCDGLQNSLDSVDTLPEKAVFGSLSTLSVVGGCLRCTLDAALTPLTPGRCRWSQ